MRPLTAKTLVKSLRFGDGCVLILFLTLALGSFWTGDFLRAGGKIDNQLTASLMVNNHEIATKALASAAVFDIQGALGAMTLQIENNGIRVQRSSCPNQVCVKQGSARRPGDILVCVPNRLVVLIRGYAPPHDRAPQESRGDAVTR